MTSACLRVLDDDFSLSEGKTSDEYRVGISTYLGDSIVDPSTVLSMSRVLAPDLHHQNYSLRFYER